MKSLKLSFAFFIFLGSTFSIFAQTIPNAGFENWSTSYTDPQPSQWGTTNNFSALLSTNSCVQRSTDARSGKYSVKISAAQAGTNVFPGAVFQGSIKTFKGVPYTSQPSTFSFSYKGNIAAGDSAKVLIAFYNYSSPFLKLTKGLLGGASFGLKGSHTSWIDTSVTLNYITSLIVPETMVFAVIYSNPQNNTFIQVDSLIFSGSGTVKQLPNNNFENWDSTGVDQADGWFSLNKYLALEGLTRTVSKSTDAHNGSYAIQLQSDTLGLGGNDTFALITTGTFSGKGMLGGFAANTHPNKLSFYYKYTPGKSGDSGNVAVWLRKNGKTVDSSLGVLPPASTYTLYELTIPGTGIPDTINIAFSSSNVQGKHGAALGSILLLDDLSFTTISGIDEATKNNTFEIYPNPANESFSIQYKGGHTGMINFVLINSLGQEVMRKQLSSTLDAQAFKISCHTLPSGIYMYSLQCGNEEKSGKIILH